MQDYRKNDQRYRKMIKDIEMIRDIEKMIKAIENMIKALEK